MAAIALVNKTYAQQAVGSKVQNITVPATTAGNLIVVCVMAGNGNNRVTSVTDNATGGSNTYVQCTGARSAVTTGINGNRRFSDIWYCEGAARGGATTITVNFNNNTANFPSGVGVLEYSGALSTGAFLTAGANSGSANPAVCPSLSVSTDGDVLVTCITLAGGSVTSVASPWTLELNGQHGVVDYSGVATGTYNASITFATGPWCASAVNFANVEGGSMSELLLRKVGA